MILSVPGALAIGGIAVILYFIWFQISFYQGSFLRIIITTIGTIVLAPLLLILLDLNIKTMQTAMGSDIPFEKELLLDKTLNNIRNNLLGDKKDFFRIEGQSCTSKLAITTYELVDTLML